MIEDVSAKRLYELREKNGLSTRAAAERIGTSSSVWNRWENGKNRMTSFFIIQICKEFGVSADWLLGLID